MAITVQLTDDTTTFDLVYDASSQPNYHARKGLSVTTEDTDVLEHRPDNAESVPIRGVDRERTLFLTKDVLGDTENEVLDKIAAIKRMVDGADQQALRYHTHGDVARVKVKMKRSTATNYTYQIVKWGHVDDSGAHYTAAAQNSGYAIGILVTLHLTAYGEGDPITLRNDCPSSPHFLEDSDSNGLADGYTSFGSPSTGLGHGKGLTGGQSQGITTGSTGAVGFNMTNYVTAATTDPYVAYVWLSVNNTLNDIITITVQGAASTTLAQKTFNPASPTGYDKTIVGPDGNTWYRYSFSDSGSPARAAANLRLRIARESANATRATTWYTDNLFIMVGTETVPDAWCSTSAIKNRYDPAATSAATEGQINYVDVWGVPGDSNAVAKTTVTLGSVSRTTIMASRHTDGEILAADIDHWIDSNELTTASSSGTWSTQSDANRSNGSYKRFTEGGSPGINSRVYILLTGSDARSFLKYPRRFFIIAKSSSTTSDFVGTLTSSGVSINGVNSTDLGTGVANTGTWELLDLGLVDGSGFLANSPPSDSDQEISITTYVQLAPSSSTNDIDALFFPVVGDEFAVWTGVTGTKASGGDIVFDGTTKSVISEGSGINENTPGSLWYVSQSKMNRYIFSVVGSSGSHTLTDTMTVSFVIYPRTRHLLGTS